MIKIVLLIPTLDQSGAEKQLALLATGLPRDEFDVHVVTLTRGGHYEQTLQDAGISVTHINKRLKFDPFALRRLKRLIQELQPDIVHSWLFAASAYARLIARLMAGKQHAPAVIVSERCVDSWKSSWQLWLDRKQVAHTNWLVGNSAAVVEFYRNLGHTDERTSVIHNGISIPQLQTDRGAVLAELDIPPGAKVVGFVGRLAKQKRVTDLVWAMQLLRQCTENVYFIIVGDGPERDRTMEHARNYACDHLIRWTGHRNDSLQLMSTFNVFWFASEFEGLSNSVMEAMSLGIPVVASDIPPNRELIVDGETGFLTRVGDSLGLSQYADRIMADEDLAARMSKASVERIREHFSVEKMVGDYARLYRDVLNQTAAKSSDASNADQDATDADKPASQDSAGAV